jgi:hypothetical protein
MRVVKYGRTSKETVGTVNGKNKFGIDYLEKQKRGRFDIPEGVDEVSQWTIVGVNHQPFCQGGDSGSWVVNIETGKLVALHFGGSDNSVRIRALVTNIVDVFKSIEEKTESVVDIFKWDKYSSLRTCN